VVWTTPAGGPVRVARPRRIPCNRGSSTMVAPAGPHPPVAPASRRRPIRRQRTPAVHPAAARDVPGTRRPAGTGALRERRSGHPRRGAGTGAV